MTALKSLLAATDFSDGAERAARRAGQLARALGAKVELLHVVAAGGLAELRTLFPGEQDARDRILAEAERRLAALAQSVGAGASHAVAGELPEAILEAAAAHDVLVVGAHGGSALHGTVFGTTAARVVLGANLPVLAVKTEPQSAYGRIVVPCEYAPPARRALELALRVAPTARITLVHAYEADYEATLWRAAVPPEQVERLREDALGRTRGWLEKLRLDYAPGADVEVVAEFGNPRRAILDLVRATGADLVVMGKQGRSKARDFFLGSVTRSVMAEVPCDVLVAPASA